MSRMRTWWLGLGTIFVLLGLHTIDRWPGVGTPRMWENRPLAPAPAWPRSIRQLAGFPREADAYVADNFPARPHLIAGLNYLRYRLGYSSVGKVMVGGNGWLFYDDGAQAAATGVTALDAGQARTWVETLASRTARLGERGITYVVLVPPVKERVYAERAPARALADPRLSDAGTLAGLARATNTSGLLVLAQPMRDARDSGPPLYTAYDTHWTGHGAYVAYRALLAALQRQGHAIAPLPISAFATTNRPAQEQPQDLALMLGISSFIRQDFPQFSGQAGTAAPAVRYLTERTDWLADRVIETGHRGKPVLLVTGDSFMNELLPFLYPHFSRIVFAHNGNAYFRPDLIDAYNPQVVLLEVHEPQLRLAMSIGATDLQLRKTDRVRVHTDPSELGACSVDSIAVGPNDQGRPMIEARGWVADAQGGRVAPTATLVLQSSTSTYQASIQVNLDRTDVADYFKQPGLARSGFYLMGDAAGLEPGAYAVYLLQQYGADTLMCVTPKRIELPATK